MQLQGEGGQEGSLCSWVCWCCWEAPTDPRQVAEWQQGAPRSSRTPLHTNAFRVVMFFFLNRFVFDCTLCRCSSIMSPLHFVRASELAAIATPARLQAPRRAASRRHLPGNGRAVRRLTCAGPSEWSLDGNPQSPQQREWQVSIVQSARAWQQH